MKLLSQLTLITSLLSLLIPSPIPAAEAPRAPREPRIQMAILLDTSGSMDGLIDQARSRLWKIVNEFATMKRSDRTPILSLALYEYGKSALPAEQDYLRLILPLTTDLDKVSEKLFALTTNGGDEYCGAVISKAVSDLEWSSDPEDLKTIFIAGNEPFTQGGVDFRQAVKTAIEKGVVVNTIFCGPHEEGIQTQWKEGALLAEGSYMSIDQNQALVEIETPQDREIARLNDQLNETYIPYGALGATGAGNQAAQDQNAFDTSGTVVAQRARAKASAVYQNGAWDLVDAVNQDPETLANLKTEALPESMQEMSAEERRAHVKAQDLRRKKLQSQIIELDQKREAFLVEKRKELVGPEEKSLDAAVIECAKKMAEVKNFKQEKP